MLFVDVRCIVALVESRKAFLDEVFPLRYGQPLQPAFSALVWHLEEQDLEQEVQARWYVEVKIHLLKHLEFCVLEHLDGVSEPALLVA